MSVFDTLQDDSGTSGNATVNLLASLHEDFLLVGTTAPAGGAFGLYLGLIGADLAVVAKNVQIVSPDRRSAADKTIPTGIMFLPYLAMEAKKSKALILALEPGLPFSPNLKKLPRAFMLNALAIVLKAFPVKILICDTPIQIPGGIGGRTAQNFWTSFDLVIVQSSDDLVQIEALPYIDKEKVTTAKSFVDSAFDMGNLSERAYDEDLIASLSYDQVAYLLHLRANRARQMATAADDLAVSLAQGSQAQIKKAPTEQLKNISYAARYIYNRSRAALIGLIKAT